MSAIDVYKNVIIRKAHTNDVDSMAKLLSELFSIETDFLINQQKQKDALLALLQINKAACLLVAELEKNVIGMCTAQIVISTAEGGRVAIVEDVVVSSVYRGHGVGSLLLQNCEQWAKTEKLKRLQLLADDDNYPALDFYKKHGWHATKMGAWRKKGLDVL